MRLSCPKCQAKFSAKANARNVKCPECGMRETAPPEGWQESPGWRKGKVGAFSRVDEGAAASPRSLMQRPAVVAGIVVALLVVAGAAWWFMHNPGTTSGPTASSGNGTCTSVPNAARTAPGPVEIDLITPGVWNICSDKETIFVWVHNNGTTPLDYTWSLTGPGGAALPAGWSATFATPSSKLGAGAMNSAAWAGTLVDLQIPADQPKGTVQGELHAGGATRAFTFVITATNATVSKLGQDVNTFYDLREMDGTPNQSGPFCTTAGGTGAVKGYSFGLVGVGLNETVTLIIPPAFHYGLNPADHELAGRYMQWAATITAFKSCK